MSPEREWFPIDPTLMNRQGRQQYVAARPDPTPEQVERELLRADMCMLASGRCFQHGPRVVDDILANFIVTRKPLKEKKR